MGLIHVPAGEDTRFLPERANQSVVAFEVHHTDFSLGGQTQILSGNVLDYSKPLLVPVVTQYMKAGMPGEKIHVGVDVSLEVAIYR